MKSIAKQLDTIQDSAVRIAKAVDKLTSAFGNIPPCKEIAYHAGIIVGTVCKMDAVDKENINGAVETSRQKLSEAIEEMARKGEQNE